MGPPGADWNALNRANPAEFAAAPLTSGVPTVMCVDVCNGGLHEPKPSGGPCVRFGAVHPVYAGTSETLSGDADLGRTYVMLAGCQSGS